MTALRTFIVILYDKKEAVVCLQNATINQKKDLIEIESKQISPADPYKGSITKELFTDRLTVRVAPSGAKDGGLSYVEFKCRVKTLTSNPTYWKMELNRISKMIAKTDL